MKTKTTFKKGHAPSYTKTGNAHHQYKHGLGSTKERNSLYRTWSNMKRRCQNKNSPDYARYGGAGITVCLRWQEFPNFLKDMEPTFKEGLSIDRKDNTKGYSLKNCRWATLAEQQRNKRSVRKYKWKGKVLTISELAAVLGVKHDTLYRRLERNNWNLYSLLSK